MTNGSRERGVLVCLGERELVLSGSAVRRHPLVNVREVVRPGDPIWDGALKGAAVGVVTMILCSFECGGTYLLRMTGAYAMFGAAVDAMHTHREVIYRGGGTRAAVVARWRF